MIFVKEFYSFGIMKKNCIKYYGKILKEHLLSNNMRRSSSRERLLEFLCDENNGLNAHFDADEAASRLTENRSGVSRASVFRNLTLFSEIGILRKSKFGENHFHYELAGTEKKHHQHLICKKCGAYIEFEEVSLKNIAAKISQKTGFEIADYKFEAFGICKKCGER